MPLEWLWRLGINMSGELNLNNYVGGLESSDISKEQLQLIKQLNDEERNVKALDIIYPAFISLIREGKKERVDELLLELYNLDLGVKILFGVLAITGKNFYGDKLVEGITNRQKIKDLINEKAPDFVKSQYKWEEF